MSKKLSIDYIKNKFLYEGYILLDTEYINNSQRLNYICPKGHRHAISWGSWSSGGRCAYCSRNAKMNINDIKKSFASEGYILLSNTYRNAHTHLTYICPRGHEESMTWSNWNHTHRFRCPKCSNRISKQEKEIQQFIMSLNIQASFNDRSILVNPATHRPMELDVFIPGLNKAIEFNGEYWHTDEKRSRADIIKKDLCYQHGVDLLIIYYKDWITNKQTILDKIKKFIMERRN
jgi:DNA-directed RNA polymerase subunit RPC12/RpoP